MSNSDICLDIIVYKLTNYYRSTEVKSNYKNLLMVLNTKFFLSLLSSNTDTFIVLKSSHILG